MSASRKFLFGQDFREPGPEEVAAREAADRAALEDAAAQAFARGVQDGIRQAQAEAERRLALAAERIAAEASARFGQLDGMVARVETDALAFFDTLARRLAGSALAAQPLAAVADAAAAAFPHLRGVPHLVARIDPALVEDVDELLRRLGREHGFEGRIIVIGDEDLGPGDVRLDWAEGGVASDRAVFERTVAGVLAATGSVGHRPDDNGHSP